MFYTLRCFDSAFIFAHNELVRTETEPLYEAGAVPLNEDGSQKQYEEIARPGFFNGRMLTTAAGVIGESWRSIGSLIGELIGGLKRAEGIKGVFFLIQSILSVFSVVTFGLLISAFISVVIMFAAVTLLILYRLLYSVSVGIERLDLALKRVSYRCDFCKAEYKLPVYICPECGIQHDLLRPSKFGIFHRRCTCGTVLPSTSFTKTADKRRRSELPAQCPCCGRSDKAGLSRPLGIALIGGAAVGKTTFKTAFLYKFINEESVKYGMDVSFPDEDTEFLFGETEKSFKGMRPVPATKPGAEYDVVSFNFFVDHPKFDVQRYVHIYDLPGEVFETNNSKERLRHFSFSEGAVFLIDPYSMRSVIDRSDGLGDMTVGQMDIDSLVQVFLETLDGLQGMKKDGGKYILPVAVAINKVDTGQLKSLIGEPAIEILREAKPDVYKSKFDTMDYLCRQFLIANGKSNAVTLLDQNFKYLHFFSCSSMGYVPKGALVRFTPENVLAAVRWIITRTDSKMNSVWDDESIDDISDSQKRVWQTNSGDYARYIESAFAERYLTS